MKANSGITEEISPAKWCMVQRSKNKVTATVAAAYKGGAKAGAIPGVIPGAVPALDIAGVLAAVIIGGVAAAAGAGLGSGGSSEDDCQEKSSYQMRLKKDFGDTIRYDRPPVPVYARMVEVIYSLLILSGCPPR